MSSKKRRNNKNDKDDEEEVAAIPRGDHFNLDYWHGLLPNEDTAALLKNDGDFLVRAIEHNGQYNILLSIRCGTSVLNAAVAEVPGSGWDFQGNFFECIKDIVDFHQVRKRPVMITNQTATLDCPIRRKNWELRHKMITLGKELGSGSYGTVFKGTLTIERKQTTVAVKVLTEMSIEASNALWKEARVMMLYDHPNIVKMYGVCNDFTPYYLVMELVDGGAVDRYLEKKGSKLSVKARVNILIEAATGLDYLHGKGCIHRDIACRNLLINKVVKVADFGMTRRTSKYKVDPNKPMNLRWLAPEVYETAIVNKSTDVYAFGVTMYETFTVPYSIPYADWKPEKVYDKVVVKGYRLHPPAKMPRMIGDLMAECLGEPEQRPTFKTVLVCLRNFLKEGGDRGLGIF
uniref:Tyrosine-protein kinase n=1 Tax=Panagrellus redivivus TaxID=6233 RepID=A0A7E4UMM7_PANRE